MDLEAALDLLLDPISGSHTRGKTVDGITTIYVDDAYFAGISKFHKRVIEIVYLVMGNRPISNRVENMDKMIIFLAINAL